MRKLCANLGVYCSFKSSSLFTLGLNLGVSHTVESTQLRDGIFPGLHKKVQVTGQGDQSGDAAWSYPWLLAWAKPEESFGSSQGLVVPGSQNGLIDVMLLV